MNDTDVMKPTQWAFAATRLNGEPGFRDLTIAAQGMILADYASVVTDDPFDEREWWDSVRVTGFKELAKEIARMHIDWGVEK